MTWYRRRRGFRVTARTVGGAAGASAAVTLPAAKPGDLLLVLACSQDVKSTIGVGSSPGWAVLGYNQTYYQPTIGAVWAVAGASGSLTLSGSTSLAWAAYVISGWSGQASDLKTAGSYTYSGTPTLALTPGYAADRQWMCIGGYVHGARAAPTAYPAGFSVPQTYHVDTTRAAIDTVEQQRTGAQPSATWSTTTGWWASLTVGVRTG